MGHLAKDIHAHYNFGMDAQTIETAPIALMRAESARSTDRHFRGLRGPRRVPDNPLGRQRLSKRNVRPRKVEAEFNDLNLTAFGGASNRLLVPCLGCVS